MYCKFLIKFVLLHSLLVCCEFAGRVVCCFYFRLTQGKDPSHNAPLPFLKQQKLMSMKGLKTVGQGPAAFNRSEKQPIVLQEDIKTVTFHGKTYTNGFPFSNGIPFTSHLEAVRKKFTSVRTTWVIRSKKVCIRSNGLITRSVETSNRSNDLDTRLVKTLIRSNDLVTRLVKTLIRSNDLVTRLVKTTIDLFERLGHMFGKTVQPLKQLDHPFAFNIHQFGRLEKSVEHGRFFFLFFSCMVR